MNKQIYSYKIVLIYKIKYKTIKKYLKIYKLFKINKSKLIIVYINMILTIKIFLNNFKIKIKNTNFSKNQMKF